MAVNYDDIRNHELRYGLSESVLLMTETSRVKVRSEVLLKKRWSAFSFQNRDNSTYFPTASLGRVLHLLVHVKRVTNRSVTNGGGKKRKSSVMPHFSLTQNSIQHDTLVYLRDV